MNLSPGKPVAGRSSLRRIAVTGANGFVGRNLVPVLLEQGWDVTALILPGTEPPEAKAGKEGKAVKEGTERSGRTEELPEGSFSPAALSIVETDFSSPELLGHSLQGCQAVINLAGRFQGNRYDLFKQANVEVPQRLLAAAGTCTPAPFLIQISSVAAQGPGANAEGGRDETAPCTPVSRYGRTKRRAERIFLHQNPPRVPFLLLRPCSLFGPFDRSFLGLFRLARRGIFPRFCTRRKTFQLLYIDDFVKTIVRILRDPPTGPILQLGDTCLRSDAELADGLGQLAGKPLRSLFFPPGVATLAAGFFDLCELAGVKGDLLSSNKCREMSFPHWEQDYSRFLRLYPDFSPVPFATALSETWRWYEEHGWL